MSYIFKKNWACNYEFEFLNLILNFYIWTFVKIWLIQYAKLMETLVKRY